MHSQLLFLDTDLVWRYGICFWLPFLDAISIKLGEENGELKVAQIGRNQINSSDVAVGAESSVPPENNQEEI